MSETEFFTTSSPAVYDQNASLTYVRKTGTKAYDYRRILPQRSGEAAYNALTGQKNGSSQVIIFNDILNNDWYDLSEAQLVITGYPCKRSNHAALGVARTCAFMPEALFNNITVKIGTTELKSGTNDNCDVGCMIKKLIEYTPEHARSIERYEAFYPDTGADARPNKVPFKIYGTVATETGQTVNYVQVGVQGGAGAQAAVTDPTQSNLAHGNALFNITENPVYNHGYTKRQVWTGSSVSNSTITYVMNLKDYVDSLGALSTLMQGFQLEVRCQRNEEERTFQLAGVPDGGNAGEEPKFQITSIELQIPAYKPDEYQEQALLNAKVNGRMTRRKWVDKDIFICPQTVPSNSTKTTVEFVGALDRRPVGCFIAYRYRAETIGAYATVDYSPYNGNSYRFYNPGVTNAKIIIGNSMIYPEQGLRGAISQGNHIEMYREFLRLTDYIKQTKFSPLLNFDTYCNHKFLIPFDFRDIDERKWMNETTYKIRFECDHAAITAIPADLTNPRNQGSPAGGDTEIILILFTEREMIVNENAIGTSIEFNTLPLE